MSDFNLRTAPLKFRREASGAYLSTCGEPCGAAGGVASRRRIRARAIERVDGRCGYSLEFSSDPAAHLLDYDEEERGILASSKPWELCDRGTCGRFRIHQTKHKGYGSTLGGRMRWWVKDVAGNVTIGQRWSGNQHSSSLERAVQMLCLRIGSGLRDGFEVLARFHRETAAADAARERAEAERADRVTVVATILSQTYAHLSTNQATAEQVVDALFGEVRS